MKYSIVYSSATGNTAKLAEAIKNKFSDGYCGKPSDEALEADTIFIGFWAIGNSCGEDIKKFIEKLSGKKIFIFGTCGYDNTKDYFDMILDKVKGLVPESNTVVGEYMCQGKVSEAKQNNIKETKPEKYQEMKSKLEEAENHPNEDDINGLISKINEVGL